MSRAATIPPEYRSVPAIPAVPVSPGAGPPATRRLDEGLASPMRRARQQAKRQAKARPAPSAAPALGAGPASAVARCRS